MKFQIDNILLEQEEDHAALHESTEKFQSISESDLWDLFKEGDTQVFNFVYVKYFPILINYGHQFTKDRELVKDVIQDLFIYLKEKRKTLGPTTSIKFYLYKAYRRRILRYLSKKKYSWEGLDYHNNIGFEVALSQESKMINSAINEEIRQKLEHAFEALTKRQKEIIIYYFYEDFSYKQITSVMGFSKVQYARILVSRSIAKLRKELGDLKMILFLLLFTFFIS
jgi:RNA polymerase sigma-70 factor (ECF subfamily)